ncbi:MAG: sulfurtransferase, partial [Gammaproteobacteria bacterium]|nr:sulfurtransferase [Gammaproteobacteria bacterium]
MDPLVTTAWLAAELRSPDLVVLDATWYMPGDARHARELFAAGRIPGARFFDVDQIADRQTSLPHMVPTPEFFAQQVGALGVSNASRVLCYDQHGIMSAPRARWMFRLYGHDQVAVLDGGLPAWRAEGRDLESGAPAAIEVAGFRSAFRAGL